MRGKKRFLEKYQFSIKNLIFQNPGENLNNLFLILGFGRSKVYFILKFHISGLNAPTEEIKTFLKFSKHAL